MEKKVKTYLREEDVEICSRGVINLVNVQIHYIIIA
jgi:hypothetical protein